MEHLLSIKERKIEEGLRKFVKKRKKLHQKGAVVTENLVQEEIEQAVRDLNSESIIIGHKYEKHLRSLMYLREHNERSSSSIKATIPADIVQSKSYGVVFNAFINDSENVSFKTGMPCMLKNIPAKEAFVLTYFAMVSCDRSEGDEMLQLICSGQTSSGNCNCLIS